MPTLNSTTSTPLKKATISAEQMVQHEGLVRWVVRQQWLGGMPFDDALHEGRLGLWSALRRYDPQRGTAFSSYAVPAITRAVWRAVAVHRRPSCPTDLQSVPAASIDPVEMIHRTQVDSALRDLVEHLPARLREIVIAYYGLAHNLPQTFAAIGHTMGVSRQRAHQLHVTAISWLVHPAHSLALRRLLERHSRSDYRKALARRHTLARKRRRRGPSSACSESTPEARL